MSRFYVLLGFAIVFQPSLSAQSVNEELAGKVYGYLADYQQLLEEMEQQRFVYLLRGTSVNRKLTPYPGPLESLPKLDIDQTLCYLGVWKDPSGLQMRAVSQKQWRLGEAGAEPFTSWFAKLSGPSGTWVISAQDGLALRPPVRIDQLPDESKQLYRTLNWANPARASLTSAMHLDTGHPRNSPQHILTGELVDVKDKDRDLVGRWKHVVPEQNQISFTEITFGATCEFLPIEFRHVMDNGGDEERVCRLTRTRWQKFPQPAGKSIWLPVKLNFLRRGDPERQAELDCYWRLAHQLPAKPLLQPDPKGEFFKPVIALFGGEVSSRPFRVTFGDSNE